MPSEGVKKRPTIRDLGGDPAALKKEATQAQSTAIPTPPPILDDEGDGVMVPGKIPDFVSPLSSKSSAGAVPRYADSLKMLLDAHGQKKSASLALKQFGDEGAEQLASLLDSGTGKNLEALDISCNSIGASGAKAISSWLATNDKLETLDISTNGIGDDGCEAMAKALESNASLTQLDLHACAIGDRGATALANALGQNFALKILNLKANYIADDGAVALGKAAAKSKTLRCLITTSNDIGKPGRDAIEDAFASAEQLSDIMPYDLIMKK